MSLINKLPTALPKDSTPETYSGTDVRTFLVDLDQTLLIKPQPVTNTAAVTKNAVTMQLSSTPDVTIPAGTVLEFGSVAVTVTDEVNLTSVASAVTIAAAPANIGANAAADYSNMVELPILEDSAPTLADDEETIKIYGRGTPIRSVNGKDLTAMVRTLAGLKDPTAGRLVALGMQKTPNNRVRLLWLYPDGMAILATVNIGAGNPDAKPGSSMRRQHSANLSGKMYWVNLNLASPEWQEIGA